MRRPALSRLAVGSVAAVALSLSAAAPGLADDATPTPSASETAAAAETSPPADPTAPVEATSTTADATASVTPSATEATSSATSSATPTIGGNGAFSYPFVLTSAEGGASTVAIEVAGTGVTVDYTLDEQGKVTDAAVAAGATLVRSTPHTIFLLLDSGETVMVKVHGESVRVKVKPVKGGPLRPGISTPEEIAADEAAEDAAEAAEEAEEAEEKKVKEDKAAKAKKAKKAKPAKAHGNRGKGRNRG